MGTIREYTEALTEQVGSRPATSANERQAAEWFGRQIAALGLEADIEDFDTPRTLKWAFCCAYVLFAAAVFGFTFFEPASWLRWLPTILAVVATVVVGCEHEGKQALSRLMPKGPSQNVVARYSPHAKYGERRRKIVLVAHLDTPSGTFINKESSARLYRFIVISAFWAMVLGSIALLALTVFFKETSSLRSYLWWTSAALAVIPTLLVLDCVVGSFMVAPSPGANDSASGLAVLLGVADSLAEKHGGQLGQGGSVKHFSQRTSSFSAVDSLWTPVDEMGEFAQQTVDLPDDFSWTGVGEGESASGSQGPLSFETIEFGAVSSSQSTVSFAPVSTPSDYQDQDTFAPEDVLGADVIGANPSEAGYSKPSRSKGPNLSIKDRLTRKKSTKVEQPADWLGLDDGFDARSAGKEIGTWDNFAEDDDGFGWKGGWAGDDPIEDAEYASNEAARIRRRISDDIDVDLDEKEVWFVATGARHVNGSGIKSLFQSNGEDLRDAIIINIEAVGAGDLYWYSSEGTIRRHRVSARLSSLARRVARETETRIKHSKESGPYTDATPALAARMKACTLVRLGEAGVPVGAYSPEDTIGRLQHDLIEEVVDFVLTMINEA